MIFKLIQFSFLFVAAQIFIAACNNSSDSLSDSRQVDINAFRETTGDAKFIQFDKLRRDPTGTVCNWKGHPHFISENKIFSLDISKLRGERVNLPAKLNPIFLLQMSQDNKLIGISSKASGPTMFIEDGANWKEIPLPVKRNSDTYGIKIASKKNMACFLNTNFVYFWDGIKWMKRPFTLKNHFKEPGKVLIGDGNSIYTCGSGGDWGGGLGRFDTTTGAFEEIMKGEHGFIHDMAFDNSGKLWFVESMAHMDFLCGNLYSLEGRTPKLHCGVSNWGAEQDSPLGILKKPIQVNFSSDPLTFDSLNICKDGSVLIGTNLQGVFQYKNGKSKRLTPEWSTRSDISSAMLLNDTQVCFSAFPQGVAVVETK